MRAFHIHLVGKRGGDLGTDFDTVCASLAAIDRVHMEPDGSFVWGGPGWQIDGMIYDRNETLRYVDLKGCCPKVIWEALLDVIALSNRLSNVVLLPEGGLYELQQFEILTWPPS